MKLPFRRALRFEWVSKIPYACAWIPAAVAILYLKFFSLPQLLTFRPLQGAARLISWPLVSRFRMLSQLNWLAALSIFRSDLLLCLIVIPICIIAVLALLPRFLRTPLLALFLIFTIFACYVEVKFFSDLGRLCSIDLLRDALTWGRTNGDAVRAYVSLGGLMRLGVSIVSVIVICWWAERRSKAIVSAPSVRERWRKGAIVAAIPLLVIVLLSWASPQRHRVGNTNSIVVASVRAFYGWDEDSNLKEFDGLGPAELVEEYQKIAGVRLSQPDPRYWSKAAGSDVIFVLLETEPAAAVPIDGDLTDLPNLSRLRERSFVASHHYSTYPYTSRAYFSIFSGWYPSSLMNDFIDSYPDLRTQGIMRDLSARGYHTALYAPYLSDYNLEAQIPKALGFNQLAFGQKTSEGLAMNDGQARESADLAGLHLLETDMGKWLDQGEHFAIAFAPQLGHHPWVDLHPDGRPKSNIERVRGIMAFQDAELGEILKLLEAHGRLEKTIIVVVGDHGFRTREEDPDLPVGMIDDVSFHVPMLLYAPQVLQSSVSIPWVTSHIDLSPSVLDLLGVDRDRSLEQGYPIWDPSLRDRTTFLFAGHYFLADGDYSRGKFSMWNHLYNSVYQDDRPHFTSSDEIAPDTATYGQVVGTIEKMTDLEQRWVDVFGRGGSQAR